MDMKKIGLVIVVILAVGAAIWSISNLTKGPMDHINMTPEQMHEWDKKARAPQPAQPAQPGQPAPAQPAPAPATHP